MRVIEQRLARLGEPSPAALQAVAAWLDEHNIGYDVRIAKVPIVPAAILFDLPVGGNPKIRPTAIHRCPTWPPRWSRPR